MKTPKCKYCDGEHYSTFCYYAPKKPIKAYKPLQAKQIPIKRSPLKKKSTTSQRKMLIDNLDAVFSQYVRLNESVKGTGTCVTCLRQDKWQNMQNGHWITRQRVGTRWDDRNCHTQCSYCNVTLSGNMTVYDAFMESRYGLNLDDIINASRDTVATHRIGELLDYYKIELLKLKNNHL